MSSTTVQSLLDTLADQISASKFDAASQTLKDLSAEYEAREQREVARRQKVKTALKSATWGTEKQRTLHTYLTQYGETSVSRVGVLIGIEAYLRNPASLNVSTVTDQLQKVRDRETALTTAVEDIQGQIDGVTATPSLSILSTTGPDSILFPERSTTIAATLFNAGDNAAVSDISITFEEKTNEGLSLSPLSQERESLSAGTTTTEEVTVTAPAAAIDSTMSDARVGVVVDSANGGSDQSRITVSLSTPLDIVQTERETLNDLRSRVIEADLTEDQEDSLTDKISAAIDTLARAERALQQSRSKQASNHLNTAIHQLGALLNYVDAQEQALPTVLVQVLQTTTELLINMLSRIRDYLTA